MSRIDFLSSLAGNQAAYQGRHIDSDCLSLLPHKLFTGGVFSHWLSPFSLWEFSLSPNCEMSRKKKKTYLFLFGFLILKPTKDFIYFSLCGRLLNIAESHSVQLQTRPFSRERVHTHAGKLKLACLMPAAINKLSCFSKCHTVARWRRDRATPSFLCPVNRQTH